MDDLEKRKLAALQDRPAWLGLFLCLLVQDSGSLLPPPPPHCVSFPSLLLDNLFTHLRFHSHFPDYKLRSVRTPPTTLPLEGTQLTPEKGTASILCPEAPFHGRRGCQAFARYPCSPLTAPEGHDGDIEALW